MLRWVWRATVIMWLTLMMFPPLLHAATSSEPVELTVPATTVTIDGYAAPNVLVTITTNATTVASVTADALGYFSTTLTRNPGIQVFSMYFTDTDGNQSQTFTRSVSIQPQQDTQLSAFLSPTIVRASQAEVARGSIVVVRGQTLPNKLVTISLDYGLTLFQTSSDANGNYQYTLATDGLIDGVHTVSAATIQGADLSETSAIVSFKVVTNTEGATPPDIIVSPAILPPPTITIPQDGARIDGDSVTFYGESLPNAQINIYENGLLFGTTTADEVGSWSFFYIARYSPVAFTFEACIDSRCSVQSQTIRVFFSALQDSCNQDIGLQTYRYWNVSAGKEIALELSASFDGTLQIEWGDGTREQFTVQDGAPNTIPYTYANAGNYNGTVRFQYGSCEQIRYFSVVVDTDEQQMHVWVFIVLALSLLFGSVLASRESQTSKNRK